MEVTRSIDVNLEDPPERRWDSLVSFREGARKLIGFYVDDLGGLASFAPVLRDYGDAYVEPEYLAEISGVARVLNVSPEQVLLSNLYYDAIKFILSSSPVGCTGFAIDTPGGPLHARNLDWTGANGALAAETIVINYRRGSGPPLYRVVGWPGFIGCLSGVAPGRFAVTLNAVISMDAPALAPPISLVLRRALETAKNFGDAVRHLTETSVASDSLLLVTGTAPGQMVVIERAPSRAAVREAVGGSVVVTNDYRALAESAHPTAGDALAETSCSRHDRASDLLRAGRPVDAEGCLRILRDSKVRMQITVQQMVLSAAHGFVRVEA